LNLFVKLRVIIKFLKEKP